MGNALVIEGKFQEAIAEFREATRLRPDDLRFPLQLG